VALAKHYEEICERRAANGAWIVFDYQYPVVVHPSECVLSRLNLSFEEKRAVRAFARKANAMCSDQLSREKAFLYQINKPRTEAIFLGYLPKITAANIARTIPPGCILDLDNAFGGALLHEDYLFVSGLRFVRTLRRCEGDVRKAKLVENLISEGAYRL
jgi:hypothetical protein